MVRPCYGACILNNNHQDMGRSRGGPDKQDSRGVDANGLPVHLAITPGEAHDNRLCSVLLGALCRLHLFQSRVMISRLLLNSSKSGSYCLQAVNAGNDSTK